jgi:hypothetical protein
VEGDDIKELTFPPGSFTPEGEGFAFARQK